MLTRRSKIDMLRGQLVPAQIDDAYPERRDEIQAARCDFFSFCRLRNPKFYKPERKYLVELRLGADHQPPAPARQELHRAAV